MLQLIFVNKNANFIDPKAIYENHKIHKNEVINLVFIFLYIKSQFIISYYFYASIKKKHIQLFTMGKFWESSRKSEILSHLQ